MKSKIVFTFKDVALYKNEPHECNVIFLNYVNVDTALVKPERAVDDIGFGIGIGGVVRVEHLTLYGTIAKVVNTNNIFKQWDTSSHFIPLTEKIDINPDEWAMCPSCFEQPRIWIFDNGEYAMCKCQSQYDKYAASGKSIWEYHREHKGDMTGWNHNDLRDKWNARCDGPGIDWSGLDKLVDDFVAETRHGS